MSLRALRYLPRPWSAAEVSNIILATDVEVMTLSRTSPRKAFRRRRNRAARWHARSAAVLARFAAVLAQSRLLALALATDGRRNQDADPRPGRAFGGTGRVRDARHGLRQRGQHDRCVCTSDTEARNYPTDCDSSVRGNRPGRDAGKGSSRS